MGAITFAVYIKPKALEFVPKRCNYNPTLSVSTSHRPLLQNETTNITQIWTHYTSIYEKQRLELFAPYFNEIPAEIWKIILEYEYDATASCNMFVLCMYRAINTIHALPWLIGWVQLCINALVLSQIYKAILHDSMHFYLLYWCGIILLIASSIQLIGALLTLCFILCDLRNVEQLALLKEFMFVNNPTDIYMFCEHNGWEMFIEFEKWCNVIYVTDLSNQTMTDVLWMYLCKPLYCMIYAIFLIMQSIRIVMWIWIPFIILLWYLALHTFLKISSGYTLFCCLTVGALSYCAAIFFHSIIMDNITFNKAIELTMFVNSGIVGAICFACIICLKLKPLAGIQKYLSLHWIFISFLFTAIYICEVGVNIFYGSEYVYAIWMCLFRLCGMYCWYLSFNLAIFIAGNHKHKNFDTHRFMACCWLFACFDLHCVHDIFHKPYNQ